MTDRFPITPPPELVEQWLSEHYGAVSVAPGTATSHVATQAARWGADMELEACCRWIEDQLCMPPDARADVITQLDAARRPKPPSLKEQALSLVPESGGIAMKRAFSPDELLTIRRALEQLND